MYKLTITSTGETPEDTLQHLSSIVDGTLASLYAYKEQDAYYKLERHVKANRGMITIHIEPIDESVAE